MYSCTKPLHMTNPFEGKHAEWKADLKVAQFLEHMSVLK